MIIIGASRHLAFSRSDYFADVPAASAQHLQRRSHETEEVRPPTAASSAKDSRDTAEEHCNYLLINGRKLLKDSVVTSFLTSGRSRKVTVRVLRSGGATVEDLRSRKGAWDSPEFSGENMVKCADIAGALVRAGDSICLAVIEIIAFEKPGDKTHRLTAVKAEELEASQSGIFVVAQVLDMQPALKYAETVPELPAHDGASESQATANQQRPDGDAAHDGDPDSNWLWTGRYLRLGAVGSSQNDVKKKETNRQYTFTIPGSSIYLLGPSLVPSPQRLLAKATIGYKQPVTWSLSAKQLNEAVEEAWDALDPTTEDIIANIEHLPIIETHQTLPYRDIHEDKCFVVKDVPKHLTIAKPSGDTMIQCQLCTKTMPLHKMRYHVGLHILRAQRGEGEPDPDTKEIGPEPCGFCGTDGCFTQLTFKGKSSNVISNCPYHYRNMSYAAAKKCSRSSPCTNVPIHCPLCPLHRSGHPTTIWKYNAELHFSYHLASDPSLSMSQISQRQFLIDKHISKQEESWMKIDVKLTETYRSQHSIPDSDYIEDCRATVKRERAESTVVQERQVKVARGT